MEDAQSSRKMATMSARYQSIATICWRAVSDIGCLGLVQYFRGGDIAVIVWVTVTGSSDVVQLVPVYLHSILAWPSSAMALGTSRVN